MQWGMAPMNRYYMIELFDSVLAPKHDISVEGPCCLMRHFDKEGKLLPQCVKCLRCGKWINTWNADTECEKEAK
jgi:hypothetical protein